MKRLFVILTLFILFLSCGKEKNSTSGNVTQKNESIHKEILVATVPPLKWLVQKIAGDNFEVISVIEPNANHELFEPKPEDLKKLENSKLLFTYGLLGFEKSISESLNNESKTVNVLKNVDSSELLEGHDHDDHDHNHDHDKENSHHHQEEKDPHVWFSLSIMPKSALEIKNRLIEAYPEKKDYFEKNYAAFMEEFSKFKVEIDTKMKSKTKKTYMIYHPALNYFIKDYNIKEVAVEYEGKEPTAQQIKEIIEEAKEHNITLILVQPQFPQQSIDIISKELPNSKITEFNTDKENIFENLYFFTDNLE